MTQVNIDLFSGLYTGRVSELYYFLIALLPIIAVRINKLNCKAFNFYRGRDQQVVTIFYIYKKLAHQFIG